MKQKASAKPVPDLSLPSLFFFFPNEVVAADLRRPYIKSPASHTSFLSSSPPLPQNKTLHIYLPFFPSSSFFLPFGDLLSIPWIFVYILLLLLLLFPLYHQSLSSSTTTSTTSPQPQNQTRPLPFLSATTSIGLPDSPVLVTKLSTSIYINETRQCPMFCWKRKNKRTFKVTIFSHIYLCNGPISPTRPLGPGRGPDSPSTRPHSRT